MLVKRRLLIPKVRHLHAKRDKKMAACYSVCRHFINLHITDAKHHVGATPSWRLKLEKNHAV